MMRHAHPGATKNGPGVPLAAADFGARNLNRITPMNADIDLSEKKEISGIYSG
jgi:hypothetical protein